MMIYEDAMLHITKKSTKLVNLFLFVNQVYGKTVDCKLQNIVFSAEHSCFPFGVMMAGPQ
jgi:hypothetical protein